MTKYCSFIKAILLLFVLFLLAAQGVNAGELTETVRLYPHQELGMAGAPFPGTWQQVHSSTFGRRDNSPAGALDIYTSVNSYSDVIYRSFFTFDTTQIPENAYIKSASMSVVPKNVLNNLNDTFSFVEVFPSDQSEDFSISYDDIELCGDNLINPTNSISQRENVANFTDGERYDFQLSTSSIEVSEYTNVCLREGHDILNQQFQNNSPEWLSTGIVVYSSDSINNESLYPYLEITYTYDDGQPPVEEYPLYTQVESPFPSVTETADWADDEYAAGNSSSYWCGSDIAGCGCVITSLVMAGRNAGLVESVVEDDVNPGNINAYLQSVSGYTSGGAVRWLAASAYVGEFLSDGTLASRLSGAPQRPAEDQSANDFINQALMDSTNVVLAYKNGHFLWVPEKTENSYIVRDPWWYKTQTADDTKGDEPYIRDYDNTFTDARVLSVSEEPVPFSGTDFEAHLTTNSAELLFTNSVGEQVGYVDGQILIDLERASYGDTEIIALDGVPAQAAGGKHLLVYEAGDVFTIEVVGTEIGLYEFEFFTIDEYGGVTTFTANGQTYPGVSTTFTFDLETGTIVEEPISESDLSQLLAIVLSDATPQQKKFFEKWLKKFYSGLGNKTISQSLQQIAVLEKLFKAKKVEHPLRPNIIELLKGQL